VLTRYEMRADLFADRDYRQIHPGHQDHYFQAA